MAAVPKKVRDKIRNMKLFATDVDGVLTDGGMYYSIDGEVMKKFNTNDGLGLALLQQNGITVAIVTGEETGIARARAKKLKILHVFEGVEDKLKCVRDYASQKFVKMDEVGYAGDDLSDVEVMKAVGVSFCPASAVPEVRKIAAVKSAKIGGSGAIREICDLILQVRRQ